METGKTENEFHFRTGRQALWPIIKRVMIVHIF